MDSRGCWDKQNHWNAYANAGKSFGFIYSIENIMRHITAEVGFKNTVYYTTLYKFNKMVC